MNILNYSQVISDIRENIIIESDMPSSPKSQLMKSQKNRLNKTSKERRLDYKLMLFSNIRMAVLTHKHLTTAWLKVSFFLLF